MKPAWVMTAIGVLAVVAAGCGRRGRDLGPLTPQAATAGPFDTGGGAASEEVNPVRVARPAAGKETPEPAEPTGTLTRPDRDAEYQARLGDVTLPLPKERLPVLADVDEGGGSPVLVNTVLAEVNGEVITREDILGPIRPQMAAWRKEYSPEAFESRCRQVVNLKLREEISRRLVVQEATAELSEEEKKQIDTTLGQILKNLASEAGSALLLEEKLQHEGSSLQEERRRRREQLMVQQYLRKKISPTVHITHSELLNYYREVCPERYVQPTRMRLGLIAIRKSESPDLAQARAVADAVLERASKGEDFARLARRYSHDPMASGGGDWGFVTKGSFRIKAVDGVLFALETGRTGPLVETDEAFYIVKALAREDGRTVPFTEVQDELEDEIRDRKYNETVNNYIQDLYKRGYVRVMMENI
ncbi:MAG: hypothetical protein AMS14_04460 [Planctomycetes bacterium DG_20]|nr:MAG: hypothetical protein AMS14_04460 [Planctomycetes bacterium DG_20]